MRKEISYKTIYLTFSILVICFAVVSFAIAQWTEPTSSPPGDNVAIPLNVSNVGQSKVGGLILNTGGAAYGLIIDQGNVGIGTIDPGVELDITTSSNQAAIDLETTAAGGNNWRLSSDNSGNFGIGNVATGRKITIQPDGNVGIGTTTPNSTLEVRGTISMFGTRASVDTSGGDLVINANYRAQTDGFIMVVQAAGNPDAIIRAGSTNPPTNILGRHTWSSSTTYGSISVPIKKDEYVQITGNISGSPDIWWQPIGIGGLVRQ